MSRSIMWVLLNLALLVLAGCGHGPDAKHGRGRSRSIAVRVVGVVTRNMPVTITSVGTVSSFHAIKLQPQVTGMLSEVAVHSGQTVRKGQVLFRIDPRPYLATLRQAEAKLRGDRAQAEYTRTQVAALRPLMARKYVTRQNFDQARAQAIAAAAQVDQDRYAVKTARIELGYTLLRSPISGRLGAINIKTGNLVQANSSVLATINQMKPVEIDFSAPQTLLPTLRKALKFSGNNVTVFDEEDHGTPLGYGHLFFLDNTVSAESGTVMLKARAKNPDERLWPGQFVVVHLTLKRLPDALVIPSESVLQGQRGSFVYVFSHGLARIRDVQIAFIDGGLAVIKTGLKPGEKVIDPIPDRMKPNAPVHLIPGLPSTRHGLRHLSSSLKESRIRLTMDSDSP